MPNLSTDTPLVSVIIPTYNVAHYLNDALDSVRNQTYRNFEIIVVDDGSTDATAEVAQRGNDVRYYRQNQQGGGIARNTGVGVARGELIAFLDADDLWSPDKLSKQVSFYQSLPASDVPLLVYGHAKQFFSPEIAEADRPKIQIPEQSQPAQLGGTLLVSPADFARVGPYAAILGFCIDWHLRAIDAGAQEYILPDLMLFRRIHTTNMSRTWKEEKKMHYVRTIKASLDRRRQAERERQLEG